MPSATITITTIPTQVAGVAFTVTGTYVLNESTFVENLVYEDNAGAQVPFSSPAVTLGVSSFSFTNPGLTAGTHTVSVKDPLTGTVVTSNSFTVTGALTLTATTPSGVVAGTAFNFTGAISGASTAPTLTYSLNGAAGVAMTGVTSTAWSTPVTIAAAGNYTLSASNGAVTSNTVSFAVASATVNHAISPNAIPNTPAGANITFTGVLSGYAVAPSLTYSINKQAAVAMTGVTAAGWSTTIVAPSSAATYTIVVSDGTISGSVTFTVVAAQVVITPLAPTNPVAGVAFTFQGTLSGYTAVPSLTYTVNGGAAVPMTGVSGTGWAMTITLAAAGATTMVVSDGTNTGTVKFTVGAGAVAQVTWSPPTAKGGVVLSNNNYTATAGGSTTPGSAPEGVLADAAISLSSIIAWEVTFTAITQGCAIGVANATFSQTGAGLGSDVNGIGAFPDTGSGSQPAQTVFFNNTQLTTGNGTASGAGAVVTVVTNGSSFWFSDAAMRTTSGVSWNNSTTANPITNTGGFSFAGIGAAYYPCFQTKEGGGVAVLNDGTMPLSVFLTNFIAANPTVLTLSGQVTPAPKAITPNAPSGVAAGAPFTFTGTLTNYTSVPNLVYSLNGATNVALGGVTQTGWSTTLTTQVNGTNTIVVTDGTISGTTTFTAAMNAAPTPTITSITFGAAGNWSSFNATGGIVNGPTTNTPLNQSAQNATVTTAGPSIIDSTGNAWVITGGAQVALNGTTIAVTANVTTLAYVNGVVWQKNTANNWFSFTSTGGTALGPVTVSPLSQSANLATVTGTTGSIIDFNTNTWTITAGAQVAFNGTAIAATSAATELAYVQNVVWYKNATQWFSFTAAGVVALGPITTSPLTASANNASVTTTSGSIVDYNASVWTITAGAQVALNGTTIAVTANVVQIAFISGVVWQLNASANWFSFTSTGGTALGPITTSPLSQSASGTELLSSTGTIIDSNASVWAITSGAQVSLNGAALTATSNITALVYETGVVWGESSSVKADSATGTVVGPLSANSTGGSLTGVVFTVTPTTNFTVSGSNLVFNSASVAAGNYPLTVKVTASNATNSPQSYPISVVVVGTVVAATGAFSVKNGMVYDPNGVLYVAKGVNISNITNIAATNSAAQPLTTLFPGVNHVRVPVYPSNPGTSSAVYPAPSTYLSFVENCTGYTLSGTTWTKVANTGIVVEIEDHNISETTFDALPPYSGAAQTVQSAWYTSLASYFNGNPYVWIGGPNEIDSSDGSYSAAAIGAISTWEALLYNVIRAANPTCMIQFMAGVGGSNVGTVGAGGGFIASDYANMTNIVWEIHCYYTDGTTTADGVNVGTATQYVQGGGAGSASSSGAGGGFGITGAQTITSADGVVPVIIGEWGSQSGNSTGSDATQIAAAVQAAQAQGVGSTAWCWDDDTLGSLWALTNGSPGSLTGWGQLVAGIL